MQGFIQDFDGGQSPTRSFVLRNCIESVLFAPCGSMKWCDTKLGGNLPNIGAAYNVQSVPF